MPPILVACTMTSHSIFHKVFWVECWLLSTPLPWSLLNIQPERSLKNINQIRTLLGSPPSNPSPDMKTQILWIASVVIHYLPCPQIPLLIWSAYYSPPLNPSISTPHQGILILVTVTVLDFWNSLPWVTYVIIPFLTLQVYVWMILLSNYLNAAHPPHNTCPAWVFLITLNCLLKYHKIYWFQ